MRPSCIIMSIGLNSWTLTVPSKNINTVCKRHYSHRKCVHFFCNIIYFRDIIYVRDNQIKNESSLPHNQISFITFLPLFQCRGIIHLPWLARVVGYRDGQEEKVGYRDDFYGFHSSIEPLLSSNVKIVQTRTICRLKPF